MLEQSLNIQIKFLTDASILHGCFENFIIIVQSPLTLHYLMWISYRHWYNAENILYSGVLGVKHTVPDSKAFNIADCTEHSGHIQQWNPMEADFLAPKNNYAYDDEDASIVIQGYSKYNVSEYVIHTWYFFFYILGSSRRICRFYETSKGCMKGTDCQFLHLDKGMNCVSAGILRH